MVILSMSGAYSIRRASLVSVLSGLLGYKWWGLILHVSPTRLLSELMGTRRTIPDVAYYMLRLCWSIESSAHFSVLDFCAFVVLFAERYFIIVCVSPSPAGDQSWWRCEWFLMLLINSLDRVGIFNDPHATVSHSWLTTPFRSLSLLRHFCACNDESQPMEFLVSHRA